jgi:hypothetical protein
VPQVIVSYNLPQFTYLTLRQLYNSSLIIAASTAAINELRNMEMTAATLAATSAAATWAVTAAAATLAATSAAATLAATSAAATLAATSAAATLAATYAAASATTTLEQSPLPEL